MLATFISFVLAPAIVFGLIGWLFARAFGPMRRAGAIVLGIVVWMVSWGVGLAIYLNVLQAALPSGAGAAAGAGLFGAIIPAVLFFRAVRRRRQIRGNAQPQ